MTAVNVTGTVKNNKITLTLDASPSVIAAAPNSQSGRAKIVGTTHGWLELGNGLAVTLTCTYNPRRDPANNGK